jgi:ABC-type transport system involved in cytochrome bd biosynthesis fused ATPase/permease subunit
MLEFCSNQSFSSYSSVPQAGFTYPGGAKKALTDISLHVRLSSRVAVVGANGAGKSTLIKLLTAEMKPQDGKVRKQGLACGIWQVSSNCSLTRSCINTD